MEEAENKAFMAHQTRKALQKEKQKKMISSH